MDAPALKSPLPGPFDHLVLQSLGEIAEVVGVAGGAG